MYICKLKTALPKSATLNGLDEQLAEKLWTEDRNEHQVPPVVAVVVFDVDDTRKPRGKDRPAILEVAAVEQVTDVSDLRTVRDILRSASQTRLGGDVVPFDLADVLKRAFASLPRTVEQVDADEAEQQESMTGGDELRMHLDRVHDHSDTAGMTDGEATDLHDQDHDERLLAEEFEHSPDWIGWTRADMEIASIGAEADFDPTPEGSGQDDQLPRVPTPFNEAGR